MTKLIRCQVQGGEGWMFWCPGCQENHFFDSGWVFNGDLNVPTFSPSLVTTFPRDGEEQRCHLVLEAGRLRFLSDCTHAWAGQTVPLPVVNEEDQ